MTARSGDAVTRPAQEQAPKFVQIATSAAENGIALYALDENGDVWRYVWRHPVGMNGYMDGWQTMSTTRLR